MADHSKFKTGDILRFGFAAPFHYAIYIGDGEIVHYNKELGEVSVYVKVEKLEVYVERLRGSLFSSSPGSLDLGKRNFIPAQKVVVVTNNYKRSESPYSPSEIKKRALDYKGKKNYNLVTRNCEHFATWCVFGKKESINAEAGIVIAATGAIGVVGGVGGAVIGGIIGSVVPVGGTISGGVIGGGIGTAIGTGVGGTFSAIGWGVKRLVYATKKKEDKFD